MFAWMGEDVEASVLAGALSSEIFWLPALCGRASGGSFFLLSQVVLIILFVGFLFANGSGSTPKLENLRGTQRRRAASNSHHRVDHPACEPLPAGYKALILCGTAR